MIAVLIRARWNEHQGRPETVILEPHSDQGRSSDAKSDEIID
jgi:hypothetical protein